MLSRDVERHEEVPARYVARALTQPEGTLALAFSNYTAFIATNQNVGWVPTFAFGVTKEVEIAASAPLRYDEGVGDWTFLDPMVDLTFAFLDADDVELGARVGALIPATSSAGVGGRLAIPMLWRATEALRVDAAVEVGRSFGTPKASGLRVPVGLTWQAAKWFYTGLGGAPNVGLEGPSKTCLDAFAVIGLTLHARERAQMDINVRLFAENVGAGDRGKTLDGGGAIISAGFFPDIY